MRALLAAVVLGGVFGSASATVESIDDSVMVVSIEVEVSGVEETVVAHLTFDNDRPLTLPLLNRGDGTFGLRTELEPKNYFVVFETLGENGEESDPVSLVQLGAVLRPESGGTTTTLGDDELSDESQRLMWLAIALGAASLSLLAFWVLGSRDEDDEEAVSEDEEEVSSEEEVGSEDVAGEEE
jgi:hypothetical protein